MSKIIAIFFVVVGFLALAVGISALCALPTMWLVNAIFTKGALVAVFGGKLTFLSAWGLNLLCALLFKSSSSSSK
jgi:DMSO/TMAO reductase YedYZ heme-binding membrane subunit